MGLISDIDNYYFKPYNLKRKLSETKQDKVHHKEGNVWTHTKMVLEQLLSLSEFKSLDEQDRKILTYAALLHDIGKPFTSVVKKNGKISAPNHAEKGTLEARALLYRHPEFMREILGELDFSEKEEVLSYVKYHGLPLFFMEKSDYKRNIMKASLEINLKKLLILSKADSLGRICEDENDLEERLAFFTEEAEKLECFNSPKQFLSDASRMNYFIHGDNFLHYSPFETGSDVIMLSGLPASGKSFYTEKFLSELPIISLDKIRKELNIHPNKNQGKVINTARERAKRLLAEKKDFVWDATNTTRAIRKLITKVFSEYNANVKIIYFEVPYENLINNNNSRERYVPEKIIEKLINNLEPPKLWEATEVSDIINYK